MQSDAGDHSCQVRELKVCVIGLLVVSFLGIYILQTNTSSYSVFLWKDGLNPLARLFSETIQGQNFTTSQSVISDIQQLVERCDSKLNSSEVVRRVTLHRLRRRVHRRLAESTRHSNQTATLIQSRSIDSHLCVFHEISKGGLGNRMFMVASLFGIARFNHRLPCLPNQHLPFDNYFHNLTLPKRSKWELSNGENVTTLLENAPGVYAHFQMTGNRRNVTLEGYLQSWRYFDLFRSDIKSLFTFKKSVFATCLVTVKNLLTNFWSRGNFSCIATLVGIHVRMGDILQKHHAQHGHTPASQVYFRNAILHFEKKYGNVIFLVISNDLEYARKVFLKPNFLFVAGQSEGVDMAVLSLMDHIILSVGTFGWWGAYLSDAKEVVYYKNWPKNGSAMAQLFNSDEYFPPSWTALE